MTAISSARTRDGELVDERSSRVEVCRTDVDDCVDRQWSVQVWVHLAIAAVFKDDCSAGCFNLLGIDDKHNEVIGRFGVDAPRRALYLFLRRSVNEADVVQSCIPR